MENCIGLNIKSLVPYSAFNLPWAAKKAKESGFAWLSLLPFRGVDPPHLKDLALPVKFVETAWNPGTVPEYVLGTLKNDPQRPHLQDILLFPKPQRCQSIFEQLKSIEGVKFISHDLERLDETTLLEVHPGHHLAPGELLEKTQSHREKCGPNLVLDLRHLRRDLIPFEGGGKSKLGPWQQSLPKLLPHTALIDIQFKNRDEMYRTLKGEKTEIRKMLELIRKSQFQGHFRVELFFGLWFGLNFPHVLKILGKMRRFV